jgi:hypothetical protein
LISSSTFSEDWNEEPQKKHKGRKKDKGRKRTEVAVAENQRAIDALSKARECDQLQMKPF